MILNKALLIKGLVGTTSALGISAGAYFGRDKISEWIGTSKEDEAAEPQADQPQESIVKKAGLTCTDENSATGSDCTIDTTKLKVDQDGTKTEGFSSQTGSGKIKLQKLTDENTDGYNQGFKLSIEDGDISLTGGSNTTIKLEEFETYEIKKDDDDSKWYLSRKTKAEEGKKKALGLGGINNCSLPTAENTPQTCSNITAEQIKAINFEGKTENGVTVDSNATASLTITKVTGSDSDFPNGYKLSLQATSGTVTITTSSETITIPANKSVEFKIKKDGKNLSLEKAWTLDTLIKKVGLTTCTSSTQGSECSIDGSGLKVKQGDSNKEEGKTKQDGSSGKIKLYTGTDATGYENNFKFFIEDGDISFTNSGTITKLEEFETYEIKKETAENKWYFSRKSNALEEKGRILGLPEGCTLPTNSDTKTCTLDLDKLKKIKFEGKNSNSDTTMDVDGSSVTLKISKTDDTTTYPNGGYKFVFETTQSNITIPKTSSGSIYIKKNTNTEFKIKKDGKNLTLEKAWTLCELVKKVQITDCPTENSAKECTLPSSLNIYDGSNKNENVQVTDTSKKLKYEEDQENHNQGFKFTVDEDIALGSDGNKKIEKKDDSSNSPSYEIKEIENKWYLSKVSAS